MKEKNLDLTPYDSPVNGGRDGERDVNEGIDRGTGERGLLRMFLKDVAGIQMLTQEEEMCVARRSWIGDEASRNHLVESNLRFVIKVVFQYWSPGLPLMDMISEGCQGLVKAAKTFDPDMGFRFLSYAGIAIAQGVIRAIKDHKQYDYESLDEFIYGDGSEVTQEDLLESDELPCDDTVFLNQVRDMLTHLNDRERPLRNGVSVYAVSGIGPKFRWTKSTVQRDSIPEHIFRRGSFFFSIRRVFIPPWISRRLAAAPAGPAPMTIAS